MAARPGGPRVLVLGGSLGGLSAALLLRDAGCDVEVYERSKADLRSRGAGIVVHELTVRYLIENELLDLDEVSVPADWWRYVDREGRTIHEETCRHRFTSWSTLHRALLGHFDADRYHLGAEVTGFDQDEGTVRVHVAGGGSVPCDLLVCADGISSTARGLLLPDVRPRYAGYVGWRGTVEEAELGPETLAAVSEAIVYHVVPHSHILTYPIPKAGGSRERGRRLTNFVWYRNVAEGDELDGLLTDRHGVHRPLSVPPGMVRERYVTELREAATDLPPALAEVVRKATEPFVQAIFDVAVDRMVFGRVCLMGDAAFSARPHAAAGTAKAAADAWALADAVRDAGGDVVEALRRWEPAQLELGRRLVARARDMGERSQLRCTWYPGDPSLAFGLWGPGR